MSVSAEKIFRLFAFIASWHKDPQTLLDDMNKGNKRAPQPSEKSDNDSEWASKFVQVFLTMKIQVFCDPSEELSFDFVREARTEQAETPGENEDDFEWKNGEEPLAA